MGGPKALGINGLPIGIRMGGPDIIRGMLRKKGLYKDQTVLTRITS